jgi:hypothetical protein
MNVGTEQPPPLMQPHREGLAIMWIKRLALFFCFMLSGILLDIYQSWWSYQFVAVCDSGKVVPGFILLFTSILLFPALMSIIFGRNKLYISICLGIWVLYGIFCIAINSEPVDYRCYRDVGNGIVITVLFTIAFSAVIFAVTCAFGWFARE